VTGLDISRGLNSKSALLFESCAPSVGLRHACISPLGKQNIQLCNGPNSLRRLISSEFQKILSCEKTLNNEDETGYSDFTYEAKLAGFHWDPHPEKDATEYVYTRRHMGGLLHRLMDAGWRVVVSADVGHHQEDTDVGEGIHSWFLIFTGSTPDVAASCVAAPAASAVAHQMLGRNTTSGGLIGPDAAQNLMNVSSRMGRRASSYASTVAATDPHRAKHSVTSTSKAVGSPVGRHQRR